MTKHPNDDQWTFDPKALYAALAAAAIIVGAIMWVARVDSTACNADELSKKNSVEISRLSSVPSILERMEKDLADIKRHMWEAKKGSP